METGSGRRNTPVFVHVEIRREEFLCLGIQPSDNVTDRLYISLVSTTNKKTNTRESEIISTSRVLIVVNRGWG